MEYDSHNNTDESQMHSAKWKKPGPKVLSAFIYDILEKAKL